MRRAQFLLSCLLLGLLVVACTPQASPAPAQQAPVAAPSAPLPLPAAPAPAVVPAAPVKPAWEAEWDRVLAGAKKEGMVTLASSTGALTRDAMAQAFQSRFGIRSEWLTADSGQLTVKIKAERRAKLYSIDATLIGVKIPISDYKANGIVERLDDILFMPDLTDPREIQKVWLGGALPWGDKDHTGLGFLSGESVTVAVNTQLVQPGEIKAYRDLLAPKWKGKIVMHDPTLNTGPGPTLIKYLGDNLMGWDYVRQLAAQAPMITPDSRLQLQWVAQGKYPIAIAIRSEVVAEFVGIAAPVKVLKMEEGGYTSTGAGGVAVLKDAPHPSAIKFFVNWLLGKEAQTIWSRSAGRPSSRLDVPTEGVIPEMILDPNKKYVNTSNEEWDLGVPEAQKKIVEIFGKLR